MGHLTVAGAATWMLLVVMLADHAALSLDALIRVVYRLLISRRHLLEWSVTSATASRSKDHKAWRTFLDMRPGLAVALLMLVEAFLGRAIQNITLAALWCIAPGVVYAMHLESQNTGSRNPEHHGQINSAT